MTYKIEKGVPIIGRQKYPFGEMEVGDSFLADEALLDRLRAAAAHFGKNHNKKFAVRQVPEGVRVWRVE
jgi:hypothetical protein